MTNLKMSVCQYPVTTLIIDDNKSFLTDVKLNLGLQDIPCLSDDNPQRALDFLNKVYRADPFTHRCMYSPEDRDIDSFVSQLDFRKIHHEIYNPSRFSQIGVVIVDYVMPMLSGIDFLRQVEESFSQRMLLTGEASQQLAIDAFNKEMINKFIQKGDSQIASLLVQSVKELQQKYFLKLSEHALNKASSALYNQVPSCLIDALFIHFFEQICKDNAIVEYYLLDEHGSFLLLDANAKPSWLIVKSEKDMENIVEFVTDQHPPEDVIRGLSQRTLVPYFHTEEDWKISYNDPRCRHYLHAANSLKGDKALYHYAYIRNSDIYQLKRNDILSFEEYLKNF